MKKLQEFVLRYINKKHYNKLHYVVGIIVGTLIHFLIEIVPLTDPIHWIGLFIVKLILTVPILWYLGVNWERNQVHNYNAQYSKADVIRGIVGGIVTILILTLIILL